jgi:hypothetical protein
MAEFTILRGAMSPKQLLTVLALAGLPLAVASPHAAAQPSAQSSIIIVQGAPPNAPPARARPRIQINPRPLLYRRCVDWYELQYRPSGTVLYPQMRCWWVRG